MNFRVLATLVASCLVATPLTAQTAPAPAAAELDEEAAPKPIEGVAASYRTPARDADGHYLTPNRDLSAEETIWHLRVALNVAALGCRDADERATVTAYNALLAADRATLASAATGMERRYQVKFGAKWRAAHDDAMTRLYNFFAQTPAQREFCTEAKAVLAEAQAATPEQLPAFAAAALPRLEAPFLAFYARYDGYLEERAAWQARHLVAVVVASAAPAVGLAELTTPVAPGGAVVLAAK